MFTLKTEYGTVKTGDTVVINTPSGLISGKVIMIWRDNTASVSASDLNLYHVSGEDVVETLKSAVNRS